MSAPIHRPRGFTLIEMLVMVFIIAVLSVIMTSFLAGARVQSRRIQCANNLRQLGYALSMYASEPVNRNFFPTTSDSADPFAVAGSTLPLLNLLVGKYARSRDSFSCPCAPLEPVALKRIAPIDKNGKLVDAGANMVSSYSYDPGHSAKDASTAVAADRKGAGANSDNHGRDAGQNVLFGSGAVEYYETPAAGTAKLMDEDIYSRDPTAPRNADAVIRH